MTWPPNRLLFFIWRLVWCPGLFIKNEEQRPSTLSSAAPNWSMLYSDKVIHILHSQNLKYNGLEGSLLIELFFKVDILTHSTLLLEHTNTSSPGTLLTTIVSAVQCGS